MFFYWVNCWKREKDYPLLHFVTKQMFIAFCNRMDAYCVPGREIKALSRFDAQQFGFIVFWCKRENFNLLLSNKFSFFSSTDGGIQFSIEFYKAGCTLIAKYVKTIAKCEKQKVYSRIYSHYFFRVSGLFFQFSHFTEFRARVGIHAKSQRNSWFIFSQH